MELPDTDFKIIMLKMFKEVKLVFPAENYKSLKKKKKDKNSSTEKYNLTNQ